MTQGKVGEERIIEQWEGYTSTTCPICGYCSKKNRSGDKFECQKCGYTRNAHEVGALQIGRAYLRTEKSAERI